MTTKPPIGRLAPSPTGVMHLGNIRSFLLAWLDIRSRKGTILMRIEDLDSPRIKAGAVEQMLDVFQWLGLDFDGEIVVQTQRAPLYSDALQQLIEQQNVYPCTCTRREISLAASAPHAEDGAVVYPLTCFNKYPTAEIAQQQTQRPACWRFHFAQPQIKFIDGVCGPQNFETAALSDFVVVRTNGEAAYQLAVVVDDAAQGVTEVLRGDDLLDSAARQIAIYQALGLRKPEFKHVPLVLGADLRRLAKRHGDTSINYFKQQQVPPAQIIGWLAYKSGLCDSLQELMPADLIKDFDLSKLNSKPIIWRDDFTS
ncbi:MAG: tRNA glutamyl-Q(34) synthetase GluQRS [Planctomycetes bacterium]|nr:tRNA glutamyl-Q(34) synthetase GluQRS [Planctomycetota bacterium]